ncbi:MAG: hypothetical protein OXC26_15085 [Albidovulum sp.]|nr:hypothetical protein [Albidovulum sp.]
MPHDDDNNGTAIPVDLIRETVMPPYEYQIPQNGFGSTGTDHTLSLCRKTKKQEADLAKSD